MAYYWLGTGASLCVFEDQTSANAALNLVADFAHEHMEPLASDPDVIRGEVKVYANWSL